MSDIIKMLLQCWGIGFLFNLLWHEIFGNIHRRNRKRIKAQWDKHFEADKEIYRKWIETSCSEEFRQLPEEKRKQLYEELGKNKNLIDEKRSELYSSVFENIWAKLYLSEIPEYISIVLAIGLWILWGLGVYVP